MCRTLEEVENELSGIPKQMPPPQPPASDGRLYPPEDDYIIRHADGRISAEARRHVIEIASDGSVVIARKKTGIVEFKK